MLDLRLYRVAFIPAVLAIVVAAFSLETRARPIVGTPLAPDAFDGRKAIDELQALEDAYPDRRPGGRDDGRLADRVAAELRQGGEFRVTTRRFSAQTAEGERRLTTVVGTRNGLLDRRIVVLAHRDALRPGAPAELSATAALLELARVYAVGRSLRHTLVLVSTSGGTAGLAGAREFAEDPDGPVDAVVVLGDMAGTDTRRPLVVPWSSGLGRAPEQLIGTADAAVRAEVGLRPGGYRFGTKLVRYAFPLTLSGQGPFLERDLPAVLVSASGERGPDAGQSVTRKRLQSFGRAALRTVTALDGARALDTTPSVDLPIQRKLVPVWAVRLVVGLLILPAALAALDAVFRVRRRRESAGMWLLWVLVGALPFLLAALLAVALRVIGFIPAPAAPAPGGALPVDGAAVAALAAAGVTLVLGWFGLRPLVLRMLRVRGTPASAGAGAAVALLAAIAVALVWLGNPYAAAALLPALHVTLLALEPDLRVPRALKLLAMALALLPVAVVAYYYARAFGLGPGELAWTALTLVAGGAFGLRGVLLGALLLSVLAGATIVVARRSPAEPAEPAVTRGPLTYAGPGSLGGTQSALRR